MEYTNHRYENDVINIINECLKLININNSIKKRRSDFYNLIDVKHNKLFKQNNYNNEIESAFISWDEYNGNVMLKYRPYKKVEFTIKRFYISEINNILNDNSMKTYVVRKKLPDAEVGTLVKWDGEKECYYYNRTYSDNNTGSVTFLTKDQILNGAEFFIEYDKYPEYYGYENPVLSRKDVLDLFNDVFKEKLFNNQQLFREKLKKLTKEKAKKLIENQDNSSQINNVLNKTTFETRSELTDAMKLLGKCLKEDDGYRQSWVANIAMSIYDEFIDQDGKMIADKDNLHTLCNDGAERFIDLLIKE
jgi:hypothetical protein